MSKATSSTRSVMITRSLCPRISWACCASCTLMVLSSLKIEPLGREHSNITSWSENTFRPNSQSTPKKLSFWDLCRANGECMRYPLIKKEDTHGYTRQSSLVARVGRVFGHLPGALPSPGGRGRLGALPDRVAHRIAQQELRHYGGGRPRDQ